MELRMTSCALCTMQLHQDDSKNTANPDGEGRVHKQCQDEHDQSHGICRDTCTDCGQLTGTATGWDSIETGDRGKVHRKCLVREPTTRMVPRFYQEEGLRPKPSPTGPVAKTLDEAFTNLLDDEDNDHGPCGYCGKPVIDEDPIVVRMQGEDKPAHVACMGQAAQGGPAPNASARARARAIEAELQSMEEAERQRQLRARELHKELESAKQEAMIEQHEDDARGWAAALWLCLQHGKAALSSACTENPKGWNHQHTESNYEFQLFSGETVYLKVKHVVGAKPPHAAMELEATLPQVPWAPRRGKGG